MAHLPGWTYFAAAGFVCLTWAASVWVAARLDADPTLHKVALFAHLGSLIVGFGAVLVIEYYGLLWLLGRRSLSEVLGFAGPLHVPVWGGLAGLVLSGVLLQPNLDLPLTRAKLVLVLVIALNGIHAGALQPRLARQGEARPPRVLLLRAAASSLISQAGWWGAVMIGFLNSQA